MFYIISNIRVQNGSYRKNNHTAFGGRKPSGKKSYEQIENV
jgi:hypothetical protein